MKTTMKRPGRRVSWTTALFAAMAAVQLLTDLCTVEAHGFLAAPKVEFRTNDEDPTAYSATIDGAIALPVPAGMHYDWGPSLAAEAFAAAFGNSSYKTLREFVMEHQIMQPSKAISPECGRTKADASPQPLPEIVVWAHGDNEGFTPSHEGPCEVWCDDERVFVEKNCAKTYAQVPAKLPYERAKCEGRNRLQIVWLALHEGTHWQVYMNCAPLSGVTPASSTSEAPLPATATFSEDVGTVHPAGPSMSTRTVRPWTIAPAMVTPTPPSSTDEYLYTEPQRQQATSSSATTYDDALTESPRTVGPASIAQTNSPTPCKSTEYPRLIAFPTRRVSEQDNEPSGSLNFDRFEIGNPFAAKATGPIPKEIFEAARKDFETEEKRKERRIELKKEFGYA